MIKKYIDSYALIPAATRNCSINFCLLPMMDIFINFK